MSPSIIFLQFNHDMLLLLKLYVLLSVTLCFFCGTGADETATVESLNSILKATERSEGECLLYLAPSLLTQAGRGVIAGTELDIDYVIETSPTIVFPQEISSSCQLDNYVFGTEDEEYSMLIFGPGSLYNHASSHQSVQHFWNDHEVKLAGEVSDLPYSDYTYCYFQTLKNVAAGQEIFEHYGEDWFDRFDTKSNSTIEDEQSVTNSKNGDTKETEGIDEREKTKILESVPTNYNQTIPIDALQRVGHCLTDVRVAESTVIDAGHGLFADRAFVEGEIVTISPVLTLPREVVEWSTERSLLMNYCIGREDSEMMLFLLSYAAMINHHPAAVPNLRMAWYDWGSLNSSEGQQDQDSLKSTARLTMMPPELFELPFAPLDIAFIATRPIEEGEELFYEYGLSWVESWNDYLAVALEESDRLARLDVDHIDDLDPEVRERIAIQCGDLCISQPIDGASDCDECTQSVLIEEANMGEWVYFRHYIEAPDGLFPEHWLYREQHEEEYAYYDYQQEL